MSGTDHGPCVICHRQLTPRFMCVDCTQRLVDMLTDLPAYYAISAAEYWPQGVGGGGKSSETPLGLRVDALDGRASRVALETLESWERCLREEFSPQQDPDHAQRERKAAAWGAAHSDDLHGVTLCSVVDWLVHNAERIAVEFVAVDELYAEVKALHKIAARAAREPQPDVTVISCPADADEGLCGASLRLTGEHVNCPRCGCDWDRPRLLLVARSVDADVWQPAGVVSEHLGVPPSTLSLWARQGHVKRRGTTFLWSSVVSHLNSKSRPNAV
jgi:hypothetical protein